MKRSENNMHFQVTRLTNDSCLSGGHSTANIFFVVAIPLFILCSCLPRPLFSQPVQQQKMPDRKPEEVLVLNSYHPFFPWTDSIVDGILTEFEKAEMKIEVSVEYLDTKNHAPSEIFPQLFALYKQKYKNKEFDVIISTDNNAFDFLLQYRQDLFMSVPIVFCGLNNADDSMLQGREQITGVVEGFDMRGTIDLVLTLHPQTKQIAVISDATPSDDANRRQLEHIKPLYKNSVRFIDFIGMPAPQLREALQRLPESTVIFFLNYYRDIEGEVYTLEEGMSIVSDSCDFPIYSMWRDKIESGALGGISTSGNLQGKNAAALALKVLEGVATTDIPVIKESPNVSMFNWKQMQRFGIRRSELPNKTVLINEPMTFYYTYRELFWETVILIIVLVVIIVFLWINVRRRKRAEEQLRELLDEKDMLMKELNHRVKNNLAIISSLIDLKGSSVQGSVNLSDIKSQVDAIWIVHDILYRTSEITHLDLREYVQDILSTMFSTFSAKPVIIENRVANKQMQTKVSICLGLIINEIAINAIKYGFTTEEDHRFSVDFEESTTEKQYVLTISNTGIPFPEEIDLDNPDTLGLRLISALVDQLGGTIELHRHPHPTFIIQFPRE